MSATPSNVQFYKRVLPPSCIAFGSEEGKKIFTEALLSGYANVYFPLAEQFRTQDEPAYCGLSTLVMVLNALAIDPKRVWKGPWRWYHEEMLDCCLSLDVVQQEGITMEQFVCLSTCNSLDLNVVRMSEKESIDNFRTMAKKICSGSGTVLVTSYSRKVLGQTGDGHFSPIGAYHPGKDLVLIFDVARFKYPPHWVSLELMWKSMKALDSATGLPRGYMMMRKCEEMPLLLFRLSNVFRVTISSKNLLESNMTKFLKSWREFLALDSNCSLVCSNLENAIIYALTSLNEALGKILEGESLFTTQFNTCCMGVLPKEHIEGVTSLLAAIECTKIYAVAHNWVEEFKQNNASIVKETTCSDVNDAACSTKSCSRIDRVGLAVVEALNDVAKELIIAKSGGTNVSCDKNNCEQSKQNLVTDSHYITMLLLCWPYHGEQFSTYLSCLSNYVDETLQNCDDILKNEAKHLSQQIQSLVMMVRSHDD